MSTFCGFVARKRSIKIVKSLSVHLFNVKNTFLGETRFPKL